MTNVKFARRGDTLVIEIDISAKAQEQAQPSASGKTKVLATTRGFTSVEGVGISLNATVR